MIIIADVIPIGEVKRLSTPKEFNKIILLKFSIDLRDQHLGRELRAQT